MVPQEKLRQLLAERVQACRVGGDQTPPVSVFVALAGLDVPWFVRGAAEFALGLPPETASAWMRAYTRTVFVAGNPANLASRFSFRHMVGGMGWIGPTDPRTQTGLRRLLRRFPGDAKLDLPGTLDVHIPGAPSTGATYDLCIPASGTVCRFLVDVHHTVAEAILRHILRPGDRLRLRQLPSLDLVAGDPVYARVLPDTDLHGGLRLLTWLQPAE